MSCKGCCHGVGQMRQTVDQAGVLKNVNPRDKVVFPHAERQNISVVAVTERPQGGKSPGMPSWRIRTIVPAVCDQITASAHACSCSTRLSRPWHCLSFPAVAPSAALG